jgi:AcrR family transcriptional regulator
MDDEPMTPKKRETRKRILGMATRVFAAEGVRNADVQVIADLARVGKGTIYRHFGNKEKLFLAVARCNMEQLSEYVRGMVTRFDSITATLRDIATAYARFYQEHPECVEIMIQERAEFRESALPTYLKYREETQVKLEELFRQGIESGELSPVDPHEAVESYADMLYGVLICRCLETTRHELVQRALRATEFFLNGVCSVDAEDKENL